MPGHRKQRKVRPNERYEGYDSKLEHDLHKGQLRDWEYHPKDGIPYVVSHKYFPDFSATFFDTGKTILIESKGRFWDSQEYSKYLWVREHLPPNYEIVFIFSNPNLPMPRAKARKGGTKLTHGEWAEKNGFRYFEAKTFKESML